MNYYLINPLQKILLNFCVFNFYFNDKSYLKQEKSTININESNWTIVTFLITIILNIN